MKITIDTAIKYFAENPKSTLFMPKLGLRNATVAYQRGANNTINKMVMSNEKMVTGTFNDKGKISKAIIETNNGTITTNFHTVGPNAGLKNSIIMQPNEVVGDVRKFTRCFDGEHARLSTPKDFYEPSVGYTLGVRPGPEQYNDAFKEVHNFIVNG